MNVPGDGLFIKHGYACENPEHYPGLSHTGENWYGVERNASEASVVAVAAGEVIYADFDYPGHVVIVQHEPDLFSMYGHLAYELAVEVGQPVETGDRIGSVLARTDDYLRSHLHFEVRTFYIQDRVNGDHPAHGFTCGYQCPPGPGYWPLDAPEHPSDLGWLNPTHAIARRMFPDGPRAASARVIVSKNFSAASTKTWSAPPWKEEARQLRELNLNPGDRYPLLQIAPGPDDSDGGNADAYRLWYRIQLADDSPVWVQAAVASTAAVGLDGKPSSILLDFIPETTVRG